MSSIPLSADIEADEDLLSPAQTAHKPSKFTLEGERVPTTAGGVVSRGLDQAKNRLVVHTSIPGRPEQSIDTGAVMSALLYGALPLDSVVLAFKRADKLDALIASVARFAPVVEPEPEPPAPEPPAPAAVVPPAAPAKAAVKK